MDRFDQMPDGAVQPSADLSTVRLSTFGLRREPPRPVDDWPASYLGLFDFDTLFYDVFRGAAPGEVICQGPPLLNCEALLSSLTFRLPGQGVALEWEYLPPRSNYQPSCRIRVTGAAIAAADRLILEIAGRRRDVAIQPNGRSRFAGRRVVMTLSKDNPLAWVRDWAAFNASVHGADAILVYDNGSESYGVEELRAVLAGVPGIVESLVVPWRFPYGPGVGPRNVQDSFFCQPGALDHVRRRYCGDAEGVLNNDIDELTVTSAESPIFELLAKSGKAAIVFPGVWVENRARRPAGGGPIRHTDCLYSGRWRTALDGLFPGRWLLRTKWIVQPARCPEGADWGVHDVYAASAQAARDEASWKLRTREVLYRHFHPLSAKPARRRRWLRSSLTNTFDAPLARGFSIAFADRPGRRRGLRLAGMLASLFGRAPK